MAICWSHGAKMACHTMVDAPVTFYAKMHDASVKLKCGVMYECISHVFY